LRGAGRERERETDRRLEAATRAARARATMARFVGSAVRAHGRSIALHAGRGDAPC